MTVAIKPLTRSFEIGTDDVSMQRRTVTARINTGCVDRYRTVIRPSGGDWNNFMRSGPAVLWEHGNDPTRGRAPVAHCSSIKYRKADDDLLAVMQFKGDPFSAELLDHYATGTLRSFSIEFLPDESKSSGPTREEVRANPEWGKAHTIYRNWEMTGVSAVSYPGNPEALAVAVERGLWVPEETRRAIEENRVLGTLPEPDEEDDEDEEDEEDYDRSRIKKIGDEWGVYSSEGDLLGKHKNKADAVQQLQAIYVHEAKEAKKKSFSISSVRGNLREMAEASGSQGGYTTKVKAVEEDDDAEPDDDEDDPEDRYIKHEGGKWIVYSEAGKVLGKHDSKADAVAQLQAIEANKHKKDTPDDAERALAKLYDQYRVMEDRLSSLEVRNEPKAVESAGNLDDGLDRHIGRQGDLWFVYAEDGSELGRHPSRSDAVAQLRSIEATMARPATPWEALPTVKTFSMQDLTRAIVESVLPISQAIIASRDRIQRDLDDLARGRV